jgi:hypothetical protein
MTGDLGVMIVRDEDFTVDGFTDVPELERETARKLDDGTWTAYGVVVVRMCDAGDWHEDYGHALWGVVVETTTLDGCVVTDPREIGDDHLREIAGEMLTAARATGDGS